MWKGRFQTETSNLVQRYGESISYDWRLYACDIEGSIAHAAALLEAGILTKKEERAIVKGLQEIRREIEAGEFRFKTSLEDIHMNIERALTEKIGPAGAKLHTARSRNDQVSLDIRLYCRHEAKAIHDRLATLQNALLTLAVNHPSAVVPGYTHLQRGQPVLFAHHLLAYLEMLERDKERLRDAFRRINVMPLGSGALAGSTIVLNRKLVAEKLGFPSVTQNSMDAVSDRDFIAEFLFWAALMMVHLSRFAEDIIIYSSREFGFVTLADAYSTGSSLMPQKKNPDALELLRGKAGRVVGQLTGLMTTLKGLPSTYNKDLQEDKEPLFDAVESLAGALQIAHGALATLTIQPAHMLMALSPEMLATDLADYLVRRGVPFREAHHVAGAAVKMAEVQGVPLTDLALEDLQTLHSAFDGDVTAVWQFASSVEARSAAGGTSRRAVAAQIAALQSWLEV